MYTGKKFIIIIIAVIFINILSSCERMHTSYIDTAGQEEPEQIEEDPKEEPTYGGRIAIPMIESSDLNPLTTSSKDVIDISGLIYEGLVRLDDELKPAPALAELWEVSEDGKVWTLKLRQDVKWHDGEKLCIDDILFTIDILESDEHDTYYAKKFSRLDRYIEKIRKVDSSTLSVRLTRPVSFFLESFTFPIIPKHIFEDTKQAIPIGTGPYKVKTDNFNLDEGFSLTRNNEYWDGKPYIDEIEVKVFEKDLDIIDAFQADEVDLLDTSVIFANMYAIENNVSLHRYLSQVYEFLAINHTNPILKDVRVRKALALGIDKKSIIKEVYLNNAEAVDVPISPNSWLFDGSSRIYDRDIDVAIDLLKEAGWESIDDGIRNKVIDGRETNLEFKLVTNIENDFRKDVAENIRLQLADPIDGLGIKIDVELLTWEEIIEETLVEGNFDLLLIGHHIPEMPDLESLFGSKGDNNFVRYESLELDELLLKARYNVNDQDTKNIYRDIQRHFIEEIPVISLYFPANSAIISEQIGGKICPREFNLYRDIQNWYVKDSK